jgi:hypothetical protein
MVAAALSARALGAPVYSVVLGVLVGGVLRHDVPARVVLELGADQARVASFATALRSFLREMSVAASAARR